MIKEAIVKILKNALISDKGLSNTYECEEEVLEIFTSINEADKKYKCNGHINDVCKGKRKTAGGYKWKYI